MATVEIYKLNKTVEPQVREYGMFEFFGMVEGPLPKNYVREWSGELANGNLETLCGKFMLNPPKGYFGGPLEKSDIAVVDGKAYFLDRESGYKFEEVDFDTSGIKDAIHVDYGYYVNTYGAVPISSNIAEVCEELDIPIGYFREPDYHGSHKGESFFEPTSQYSSDTAYLHPQFLEDDKAREFIELLTELLWSEQWEEIKEYLSDNNPVYQQDLEKARELFAPEILLPTNLRPFSKLIPVNTDKSELKYLTVKVSGMNDEQRILFEAAIEAGRHCGSVVELINLTENLDLFELQPAMSAEMYGDFQLEMEKDDTSAVFRKLETSEYPDERALAKYILRLEAHVDEEAYGRAIAEEENGVFTSHGLLTEREGFKEIYRTPEAVSAEHLASPQLPESDTQLVAPGIKSDEMLGRFLYDNKMLPDKAFQAAKARLSLTSYPEDYYRMMGRKRRESGKGSFTDAGYVENSTELPSVLNRIAADRAERAATPDKSAKDKAKSHGQEH